MNSANRTKVAPELDEEQQSRFEKAGKKWKERQCEVAVAHSFKDTEYLKQPWTSGDCKGACVVDNILNDGNHKPDDIRRFQWLCRSHNVKKNPPQGPRASKRVFSFNGFGQSLERESERPWEKEEARIQYAELAKAQKTSPAVRRAVERMMKRADTEKGIERKTLLDAVCEVVYRRTKVELSQQAAGRILDKMCSINGSYRYDVRDLENGRKTFVVKRTPEVSDGTE